MTSYVEKMVAEIGINVANHHCNQQMAALIVEKIIADTKRACKKAINDQLDNNFSTTIAEAEVKGE